ncbi:MAG: hypothetical protein EXS25_02550 [Pedosphaera sp.]|nr:hypothetical protein [Pedosphaera sp.]
MYYSLTQFGVKFVFGLSLFFWKLWGSGGDINPTQTTNISSLSTNKTKQIVNATDREFKPRDQFRFTIKEDPNPTQSHQNIDVSDAGEIHIYITGNSTEVITVDIRGKKLLEIRKEIKQKMDEKYYNNATISFDLVSAYSDLVSSKVIISGELNGTVRFSENDDFYLTDAINAAAQNPMANLKKVIIHRLKKEN